MDFSILKEISLIQHSVFDNILHQKKYVVDNRNQIDMFVNGEMHHINYITLCVVDTVSDIPYSIHYKIPYPSIKYAT